MYGVDRKPTPTGVVVSYICAKNSLCTNGGIMVKRILLTLLAVLFAGTLYPCHILLVMRRNNGTVQEASQTLVNTTNQIMTSNNQHGSGIVIYPLYANNTLPGILKRRVSTSSNSGEIITMPSDRKWATAWNIPIFSELTLEYIQFEGGDYLFADMKQFWFHKRNASTGSSAIANPHPWVYSGDGRTITFMHNGNVAIHQLDIFYQANQQLVDPEIEALRDPDPFGLNTGIVDSGLLFAVLLMNIKQADWNILSGIMATLHNGELWDSLYGDRILNFILSDGDDTYAYRGFVNSPNLLGYSYNESSAVISSLLTSDMQTLDPDDLLYMPANAEPVLFQNASLAESDATIAPQTLRHSVFPNPFNPTTNIAFTLPANAHVSLQIFNIHGQLIKTIEKDLPQGENSVVWEAQDASSGVYFYRIVAGRHKATGKMLLLK